ncbi:MAG: carbohydrate ABC transporter substrate-binding protein [Spirochaetes bacterium]|nr:carbohydrate ABC transporter substrate-binding protein [Spirochaetota bacterium]
MIRKVFSFLYHNFSIVVIVGAFAAACVGILTYRSHEAPPGAITIRMAHWQLETSVRDGLIELAADYRKEVNPNVYVVQEAIPESVYAQWVCSQLMGGTGPDLMETGGGGVPPYTWLSFYGRYFVPLTRDVMRANPYNKGTDLEGVSLNRTYYDNMISGYVEEHQEYMGFPLSQFVIRMFYNRDLLKRLTGLDSAPTNYRAFLAACEKIRGQKDRTGKPFIPFVLSQTHQGLVETYMWDLPTYGALRRCDFNRDGWAGNDEVFVAMKSGLLTMRYPGYEAKFKMIADMLPNFPPGFTGLGRDEGVFFFAQERAVFIPAGTWDCKSLMDQAKGKFNIGLMDFPAPDKTDPVFGPYMEGPKFDRPSVGFRFGLTRTSKHKEEALDFLYYLASRKKNEKLNRIIGWIPAIKGAEMVDFLQGWTPHLTGVYGAFNYNMGGETGIKWTQLFSLYLTGQTSYEKMIAEFEPFYFKRGLIDFKEAKRNWRRGMLVNEQFLAGVRSRALLASSGDAELQWLKYRALTVGRQLWPEISYFRQMQMVDQPPGAVTNGPYEYSPLVMTKLRATLR